jgi:hypothetical protein
VISLFLHPATLLVARVFKINWRCFGYLLCESDHGAGALVLGLSKLRFQTARNQEQIHVNPYRTDGL